MHRPHAGSRASHLGWERGVGFFGPWALSCSDGSLVELGVRHTCWPRGTLPPSKAVPSPLALVSGASSHALDAPAVPMRGFFAQSLWLDTRVPWAPGAGRQCRVRETQLLPFHLMGRVRGQGDTETHPRSCLELDPCLSIATIPFAPLRRILRQQHPCQGNTTFPLPGARVARGSHRSVSGWRWAEKSNVASLSIPHNFGAWLPCLSALPLRFQGCAHSRAHSGLPVVSQPTLPLVHNRSASSCLHSGSS